MIWYVYHVFHALFTTLGYEMWTVRLLLQLSEPSLISTEGITYNYVALAWSSKYTQWKRMNELFSHKGLCPVSYTSMLQHSCSPGTFIEE